MRLDEFFSTVDSLEKDANGCRIWPYGKIDGYGFPWIKEFKRNKLAHRLVLERKINRSIGTSFACHKCDVRDCVNEEHLWEGDVQLNAKDMVAKGRSLKGNKNPHFGKMGSKHPTYGKKLKGKNNPMYGKVGYFKNKVGAAHPSYGRSVSLSTRLLLSAATTRNNMAYWGA